MAQTGPAAKASELLEHAAIDVSVAITSHFVTLKPDDITDDWIERCREIMEQLRGQPAFFILRDAFKKNDKALIKRAREIITRYINSHGDTPVESFS